MNTVYFSLTPHIYAACFDNAVIILDSNSDKYLSFIDSAAHYFQLALNGEFQRTTDGKLVPVKNEISIECADDLDQLNYWVNHFIENNFVAESTQTNRKLLAPLPLKLGGLIEYCWDHKPSWKPFTKISKIQIIKALFALARVHRMLKRQGINGILNAIKQAHAQHPDLHQPTEQEIEQLSSTIDAASLLYPKKTYCLAWAATFVLLALKKNWSCNLAIGIQTNPFYAHAWAQNAGKVIHDDPVIAQVLSIILKEPTI